MTGDEPTLAQQALTSDWHRWVPFAALGVAAPAAPKNRPLATRISEQVLVAILAGGGSAYTVSDAVQARHDEQIKALQTAIVQQNELIQRQMERSEARLTDQIKELRARALK